MAFFSRLKNSIKYLPVFLSITFLTSCLDTVPFVDLNRYGGLWYEIAGYPSSFNEGLVGTTATYGLLGDGTVSVYNRAFVGTCDGEETSITGYAIAEDDSNSKLTVKLEIFPGVFTDGNYWVILLDEENYSYAVVSDPTMQSLFILNREPTMEPKLLDAIINGLILAGYDKERIQLTPQCG